ncbi:MAG: hypothetical protein MI749_07045 [Desulfovibrionales bacterium]|nr:hypothetical protein [Desulfovibrionales bacterium]
MVEINVPRGERPEQITTSLQAAEKKGSVPEPFSIISPEFPASAQRGLFVGKDIVAVPLSQAKTKDIGVLDQLLSMLLHREKPPADFLIKDGGEATDSPDLPAHRVFSNAKGIGYSYALEHQAASRKSGWTGEQKLAPFPSSEKDVTGARLAEDLLSESVSDVQVQGEPRTTKRLSFSQKVTSTRKALQSACLKRTDAVPKLAPSVRFILPEEDKSAFYHDYFKAAAAFKITPEQGAALQTLQTSKAFKELDTFVEYATITSMELRAKFPDLPPELQRALTRYDATLNQLETVNDSEFATLHEAKVAEKKATMAMNEAQGEVFFAASKAPAEVRELVTRYVDVQEQKDAAEFLLAVKDDIAYAAEQVRAPDKLSAVRRLRRRIEHKKAEKTTTAAELLKSGA